MNRFFFSLLSTVFLFYIINFNVYTQVKWYTIEEAIEKNKKEPRKIVIDVYTDWCGWCKVMDKNTFSNAIIAEYLNNKFYPVKFNAEQTADVKIGDKVFKYVQSGMRGYHELAVALLQGQLSYPSIVFLDENLGLIYISRGYVQAQQFDMISKYIGENYYKSIKWEEFTNNYKSPIVENK